MTLWYKLMETVVLAWLDICKAGGLDYKYQPAHR